MRRFPPRPRMSLSAFEEHVPCRAVRRAQILTSSQKCSSLWSDAGCNNVWVKIVFPISSSSKRAMLSIVLSRSCRAAVGGRSPRQLKTAKVLSRLNALSSIWRPSNETATSGAHFASTGVAHDPRLPLHPIHPKRTACFRLTKSRAGKVRNIFATMSCSSGSSQRPNIRSWNQSRSISQHLSEPRKSACRLSLACARVQEFAMYCRRVQWERAQCRRIWSRQ